MAYNHGPTVCQMIGETYNQAFYTNCIKCEINTCPINKIFKILEKLAPEEIREMKREAN